MKRKIFIVSAMFLQSSQLLKNITRILKIDYIFKIQEQNS